MVFRPLGQGGTPVPYQSAPSYDERMGRFSIQRNLCAWVGSLEVGQ
jgi:hypothetical protein